jgi:hypothetical protein
MSRIETTLGEPKARCRRTKRFDKFGVGICNGIDQDLLAVGKCDPHLVAAIDIDVLDVGVIDEGLQSAESEQCVQNSVDQVLFIGGVDGGLAQVNALGGEIPEPREGQLARKFAAIGKRQLSGAGLCQVIGHIGP